MGIRTVIDFGSVSVPRAIYAAFRAYLLSHGFKDARLPYRGNGELGIETDFLVDPHGSAIRLVAVQNDVLGLPGWDIGIAVPNVGSAYNELNEALSGALSTRPITGRLMVGFGAFTAILTPSVRGYRLDYATIGVREGKAADFTRALSSVFGLGDKPMVSERLEAGICLRRHTFDHRRRYPSLVMAEGQDALWNPGTNAPWAVGFFVKGTADSAFAQLAQWVSDGGHGEASVKVLDRESRGRWIRIGIPEWTPSSILISGN